MTAQATTLASLALAMCAVACVPALQPVRTYGTPSADVPTVVLLTSSTNRLSQKVVASMTQAVEFPVVEFVVNNEVSPQVLKHVVRDLKPTAIVSLGGRATNLAHQLFPKVPLVYSLVANSTDASVAGPNVAGVGLELPSSTEFLMYKLALPNLHRVVTFYSQHHDERIRDARSTLSTLDITLDPVEVENAEGLETAQVLAAVKDADAVWMPNDPGLMSSQAFDALLKQANSAKKPLLCSGFREYAVSGGTMVVTLNFENIGSQVASMLTEIIRSNVPASRFGIAPPLGASLVVNKAATEALGIEIPPESQPYIAEMITSKNL